MPEHVRKAWAYITRDDDLLVFAHPDHPGSGIQVPGGTLNDDEDPAEGALREAEEETGLSGLRIARALGRGTGSWAGKDAEMFAFELGLSAPAPDRWDHGEFSYEEPIRFAFFWIDVRDAARILWPEQRTFLAQLKRQDVPPVQ